MTKTATKNSSQENYSSHKNDDEDQRKVLNFHRFLFILIISYLYISDKFSSRTQQNRFLVIATSINYGISQQPITDINLLMPKLCQNQTVICEGSFCIPGVRKCVCDLRMPVQFGRYCLRQIDIETKCFVTSQCNHTIKDAVCIDTSSNSVLDPESSKFKLEQWQQLNELRQMSQSVRAKENSSPLNQTTTTTTESSTNKKQMMFFFDQSNSNSIESNYNFQARDDVIVSHARNSPYEINYDTQELLSQNHTKRRLNQSERTLTSFLEKDTRISENTPQSVDSVLSSAETSSVYITKSDATTATQPSSYETPETNMVQETTPNYNTIKQQPVTSDSATTTISYSDSLAKRKVIKNPQWPPGICSCPIGFMFDPMLRKCLALSLDDSHCQVDSDCKQILMTHCSVESKKCKCDEPFIWNQTELACVRPKPPEKTEDARLKTNTGSFLESLLPPLILAKLLPDYTMMLLIFIILVVVGTLIILRLTVKCFSSNSSALISPKNKKKKSTNQNNLPPRSPYATLRRPDHKPNSQLSNFTQATRGRILNYDFEQEDLGGFEIPPPTSTSNTLKSNKNVKASSTLDRNGGSKIKSQNNLHDSVLNKADGLDEKNFELNDNVSISQLESESKSDNSVLAIPAPPPTQQPPYMLTSVMKGQGSAIAAAAAAVANKRMQLAQKKNMDQQPPSRISNGSPVFL